MLEPPVGLRYSEIGCPQMTKRPPEELEALADPHPRAMLRKGLYQYGLR